MYGGSKINGISNIVVILVFQARGSIQGAQYLMLLEMSEIRVRQSKWLKERMIISVDFDESLIGSYNGEHVSLTFSAFIRVDGRGLVSRA